MSRRDKLFLVGWMSARLGELTVESREDWSDVSLDAIARAHLRLSYFREIYRLNRELVEEVDIPAPACYFQGR